MADYDNCNGYIKCVRHDWMLPRNLISMSSRKMCHLENRNNVKYLKHNWTGFHQYFTKWLHCSWPSNSCNRLLCKCRSRSKFSKIVILLANLSLKKTQRQISLVVIGITKIWRGSEFFSISPLTIVFYFKNFAPFSTYSR